MIRKIKNLIRKFIFFFIKPEIRVVNKYNTYSQAGEDRVLTFLFIDKKISKLSYLDIGTNDPINANNTYLFYSRGYRGVCVEADSSIIPLIKDKRAEDIIIHAGISVSDKKMADFYKFEAKGLNTFDKEEALRRESFGNNKIKEIVKVPLIGINQIIRENFKTYPDFISIDIEGLDYEVLKSLDFVKYPIPVICAETCTYSENHIRKKDYSIIDFLKTKGYEVYADTYINTIFVNKNWFYS